MAFKPVPPKNSVSSRPYMPKDTPEARAAFLQGLRDGLTVKDAAEKRAKVPARTVRSWALNDPEFKLDWELAYDEGCDVLEAEAHRRAVHGVEKPVYQGGELVGHVTEYSDTLMSIMLQARRPHKFRPKGLLDELGGGEGVVRAKLEIEFVGSPVSQQPPRPQPKVINK